MTDQATSTTTAVQRERIGWVDLARGFSVVAVVLTHIGTYHFEPVTAPIDDSAVSAWAIVNDALGVVRMPLLLLISGWLAASKIRQGLGSLRARLSLATNYYLYLVWLLVYLAVTIALGNGPGVPEPVRPGWDVVRQVVAPDSTLWFIYALVIFVAGLALVRRWPPWLVLFGLFVVGWAAHREFTYLDPAWARIPQLAVFFGVGVYAKDLLRRLAASSAHSAGAAILSAGLYTLLLTNPPIIYYPVYVLCSVLAGVAMLGLARAISLHAPGPARVGEWIGQRTLGIYVLHFPFVMMLAVSSGGALIDLERSLLASTAMRWYFPLMATTIIVLACLVTEEALRRAGAEWLFRLPRRDPARGQRPDTTPSDTVLGPQATRDA